jgi:hypothetical protein
VDFDVQHHNRASHVGSKLRFPLDQAVLAQSLTESRVSSVGRPPGRQSPIPEARRCC